MKVKLDFISNSSSTSFVYISNEELTEEAFLKAAGVNGDGPVGDLFRQMYTEIITSIREYGKQVSTIDDANSLIGTHEFTPEVVEKVKKAIQQGTNVVTSRLSSDGSLAESFLCTTMFEIKSDHFYINAFNSYW